MKSFFKQSAIGLAVLGMTGSVLAMSGAFIGVEGLDLKPMNGDLNIYRSSVSSTGPVIVSKNNHGISPGYNWGWRVFAGLRMNDDDFTLSWERLRASDSLESNVNITGLVANARYLGSSYIGLDGSVDFHLDEVYGVWGHTVHFNSPWNMRFAGGVEYARLDTDLTTSGISNATNTFGNADASSEMRGWGPRAEFDLVYMLPSNFMVFANTNAALLVSKRDVDFSRAIVTGGTPAYDNEDYSNGHVVVPKFGMRLGLGYTFPFGQIGGEGSMGAFTLTAGWQVESYIHAIERPGWNYGDTDISPNTAFDDTKVSNFSDQGLFLGITFTS